MRTGKGEEERGKANFFCLFSCVSHAVDNSLDGKQENDTLNNVALLCYRILRCLSLLILTCSASSPRNRRWRWNHLNDGPQPQLPICHPFGAERHPVLPRRLPGGTAEGTSSQPSRTENQEHDPSVSSASTTCSNRDMYVTVPSCGLSFRIIINDQCPQFVFSAGQKSPFGRTLA